MVERVTFQIRYLKAKTKSAICCNNACSTFTVKLRGKIFAVLDTKPFEILKSL